VRFSNSSLAMAAALVLGFAGANATAQTNQAPADRPPTDQAPGAKSDITRVQAGSDTSGVVQAPTLRAWSLAKLNRENQAWALVADSFQVQTQRIKVVLALRVVLRERAPPTRM
jgi:hypothetical protein